MPETEKTTTWGDCGNPDCLFYGRMRYGIEPGDVCAEDGPDDHGCGAPLRWWDRWHDGQHSENRGAAECAAQRRAA